LLAGGLAIAEGHRKVRLEEHVLVQVRKPMKFGRFGERPVANDELDRYERHGRVLKHDNFQAVRQRFRYERDRVFRAFVGRLYGSRSIFNLLRLCRLRKNGI
jgi:hypothetical protein